jgi:hypothetical protein
MVRKSLPALGQGGFCVCVLLDESTHKAGVANLANVVTESVFAWLSCVVRDYWCCSAGTVIDWGKTC